jgi:DNA-binding transcriptional regulator YbjK
VKSPSPIPAVPATDADGSAPHGPEGRGGYRRSAGSRRGEARRQDLLDRVTEDLAVNGLVDFSLRRAARAAGTTHKVLLYYFDGADDLLAQAIFRLRERRISNALAATAREPGRPTLAAQVRPRDRAAARTDHGRLAVGRADR